MSTYKADLFYRSRVRMFPAIFQCFQYYFDQFSSVHAIFNTIQEVMNDLCGYTKKDLRSWWEIDYSFKDVRYEKSVF